MATFGSFETEKEVYSDLVYAVYTARQQSHPGVEFAVKVFRLPDPGLEAEVAPGAGGRAELEQARESSVQVQERAAAESRFVSPILAKGKDSRGVWYATRFYPRSVNKVMTGKVALPRPSLEHIIRSIAHGALDLQRACGRSHGDIRPSNVQVGKGEKLSEVEVVLCDPLPGGADQSLSFEQSDLHAIGLILLQLVRQRALSHDDVAVMLPISPSPEWTRIFGSDASDWLALCNRLLDSNPGPGHFTLELLVERLNELKPKPRATPNWAIIGAGGFLVFLVIGFWLFHSGRGKVAERPAPQPAAAPSAGAVAVPPPRELGHNSELPATSTVTAAVEPSPRPAAPPPKPETGMIELRSDLLTASVFDSVGHELGHIAPDSPLKLTLPAGTQTLAARVPGLDDVVQTVQIDPAATSQSSFKFNYGTVAWSSHTGPVTITAGENSQVTPATFIQKPEVPTQYILTAKGYQNVTNTVVLTNGEHRGVLAEMTPVVFSVALVSDPPGALFFKETGEPLPHNRANPSLYDLPSGGAGIVASFAGLGTLTNRFDSTPARLTEPVRFKFNYGILALSNLPADWVLYEGDAKLGAAGDKPVYQKPGPHVYALRNQSASLTLHTNIIPGINYLVIPAADKSWKNAQGMWFAWVPNLPGGGQWPGQSQPGAWVGISEATQGQYKKMDGSNPSAYQDGGDNFPVENLTAEQAQSFCQWLSSVDTAPRMGWKYALPTEEQFTAFAADADRIARVTSEGRVSASMDDGLPLQRMTRIPIAVAANTARTHPEAVASTKANRYGLYDVVGNVWEWLASPGKETVCAGGSYLNFSQKTIGAKARERTSARSPNIGFRVVLVPAD
jgi:hypothetical protein